MREREFRPSPLSRRIVELLAELDGGFEWPGGPDNAAIRRTYAGHWQRAAGAWLWTLTSVGEPIEHRCVGSVYPAKVVADRRNEIVIYQPYCTDYEFIVENEHK